MRKLTIPFIGLALSLTLYSCQTEPSDSVDQDKIYTTYELNYDKNTDKTTARATFRFGNAVGTNLQLSAPAQAKFNTDMLGFNSVLGSYDKEYSGFKNTGTFAYTNNASENFTNEVGVLKTVEFPADFPTAIPRSNAFTLTWVGEPLTTGERVDVLLSTAGTSPIVRTYTQIVTGSTNIIISADQLAQFPAGSAASISIFRYLVSDLQQKPTAGGFFSGRYQPLNKSLTLQ